MKFSEIFDDFRNGKKVRSKFWKQKHFIYYNADYASIFDDDNIKTSLNEYDLFSSSDWELYKESQGYIGLKHYSIQCPHCGKDVLIDIKRSEYQGEEKENKD